MLFLRLALGWMYLYAGVSKIANPAWSAEGYLKSAKTFSSFYQWLASPGVLSVVNILNEWGLTLLGVSLILGLFVRQSAWLGIGIMALYYLPVVQFPYVGKNFLLVDDHIIFIAALCVLIAGRAGKVWGMDALRKKA